MENKLQCLYRGKKLNCDSLCKVKFYGVTMKPYYEPHINEYGRETVLDGNEYGVYMSDNLLVAR